MASANKFDTDFKSPIPPCQEDETLPPPTYDSGNFSFPLKHRQAHNIETLPLGLVIKILDRIDPTSKRCFYSTNRRFRGVGQGDKEPLTGCGRWLVMARLEQDLLDRLPSKSTPDRRKSFSLFSKKGASLPKNLTKLTCSLCKTKHGPDSFLKGAPRTQGIHPTTESQLLVQKSLQRICCWHLGKLVRFSYVDPPVGAGTWYGRWVSSMKDMCTHCGQVQDYGECSCAWPQVIQRVSKPPVCDTCPKVKIRVYERQRRKGETGDISWEFKTEKDGTLYVLENRTDQKQGPKFVSSGWCFLQSFEDFEG